MLACDGIYQAHLPKYGSYEIGPDVIIDVGQEYNSISFRGPLFDLRQEVGQYLGAWADVFALF